jgi:hypothetical protein
MLFCKISPGIHAAMAEILSYSFLICMILVEAPAFSPRLCPQHPDQFAAKKLVATSERACSRWAPSQRVFYFKQLAEQRLKFLVCLPAPAVARGEAVLIQFVHGSQRSTPSTFV